VTGTPHSGSLPVLDAVLVAEFGAVLVRVLDAVLVTVLTAGEPPLRWSGPCVPQATVPRRMASAPSKAQRLVRVGMIASCLVDRVCIEIHSGVKGDA
jgi:hypothetical protein